MRTTTREETVAEEITLEQDVDRVLPQQPAQDAVPEEFLWEREPFDDQRSFASIDPEDPEATVEDPEGGPSAGDERGQRGRRLNGTSPAPHGERAVPAVLSFGSDASTVEPLRPSAAVARRPSPTP